MKSTFAVVLILSAALGAQDLAITHVRAHPITSPVIEDATILIRDGIIKAVGVAIRIPEDIRTIDASGKDAWPGFIDGWTTLGLSEIGSVSSTVDTREIGEWQAHLRARAAINPFSAHIPVARVNGVTTAAVVASGGAVGPEAAVIDLAGRTVEDMLIPTGLSLRVLTLPRPPRREPRQKDADFWKKVEKSWEKTRKLFERARELKALVDARGDDLDARVSGQERLALLALGAHLERGDPFLVRVESRDAILAALRFAKKHDLHLVLAGLRDAWEVVAELRESGHRLLLGSVFSTPRKHEPFDAAYASAAVLHRAGLTFGFMTASSSNVRNLPYAAAMAVSHGLPREAAMRALTLGAAEALGIAGSHGSLFPGKVANIVITSGDPLDVRTSPTHVLVRGRLVPLTSRHTELAAPFLAR